MSVPAALAAAAYRPTPAIVRRSWISPASISASTSSSVAQRIARSSVGSGAAAPAASSVAMYSDAALVRHRVRQREPGQLAATSPRVAGLLGELAPRALEGVLVEAVDPALGDLPAVRVERVAVLADEQHPPVVADRDHAHRGVGSARRRRSPALPSGRSTSSCRTSIHGFS